MTRIFAIFVFAFVMGCGAAFSQDVPDPDLRRPALQSQTPLSNSISGRTETRSLAQQQRENWRQLMLKRPAPTAGCYTTAFPSTEWQEVPCSTESARPHPPALGHPPQLAGAGNDPFASVSGTLTSATGSLHAVTGVTQESDPGGQNSYSLQLNTNNFTSASLCAGQAGCVGWQQFIRDNPGNVYIQYWLINHTSPCPAKPSGWQFFAGGAGQSSGCFVNGNQTSVPTQALSDLQGMRVTGATSASAQSVVFETSGNQIYTAKDNGDLLGIGTQWNQAEFNIFGLCCGNQATFNTGSSIVVQVDVNNGTQAVPTCPTGGFTAESSNLNLAPPCFPFANSDGFFPPAVLFTEDLRQTIPGCAFPNGATACVAEAGSTISDGSYTATCPASGTLSMQRISNGQWLSLPQHCSDGSFPGSCNPSALVAKQFVLGTQQYGVTYSGAPIGSTQTVHLCDTASRCSQFTLDVTACAPLPSPNDKFYLNVNSSPFQLQAGGASEANLIMDGPWIAPDHGNGAIGTAFDTGGLPPGTVISLSPGESGSSVSYGLMNMYVFTPLSAPAGQYSFQVKATDPTSNVTQKTTIPVQISACVPRNICPGPGLCGPISDGCGGSVQCGACASGVCSNSFCCPSGSFYNTALNTCEPNSCPSGTEYCYDLGICTTAAKCNKASNPRCRKVGHIYECQ